MTQRNVSALVEVTQTSHQENKIIIHINPNTTPSGIYKKTFKEQWLNFRKEN